jgi:hypothetical protein
VDSYPFERKKEHGKVKKAAKARKLEKFHPIFIVIERHIWYNNNRKRKKNVGRVAQEWK